MTKDDILDIIKESIREILPDITEEKIEVDKNLKNLGANSIDRVEIITMVMEELGINIPLLEFGEVKNIMGMVELFYSKMESCSVKV